MVCISIYFSFAMYVLYDTILLVRYNIFDILKKLIIILIHYCFFLAITYFFNFKSLGIQSTSIGLDAKISCISLSYDGKIAIMTMLEMMHIVSKDMIFILYIISV